MNTITQNIPLMMPNRNGLLRIDTMITLNRWQALLVQSNINLIFISAQASNIPRARNACMDAVRNNTQAKILMMWLDSDMVLPSEDDTLMHLNAMLQYAINHRDAIICCDYRTTMGDNEFQMRKYRTLGIDNEPFKNSYDVYDDANPYTNLGCEGASGFGLCMGYFPRGYIFHADTLGEDIYFWNDNPNIELVRYNHFIPGHAKEVVL